MGNVTVTAEVAASAERVWRAFASFGDIHRFHPHVQISPLLTDQRSGVGAKRRCQFYDGNHVVEEVVGWEDGRAITVDILEGSMPLKKAQARIEIAPLGKEKSEVRFTMRYEPKFGLLGQVMDALLLRSKFRGMLSQVLGSLETHLTTGVNIGKDGKLDVEPTAVAPAT